MCNREHTLYVLIIATFHFVIVSKPTNRITQESPCKGAFVESYLQDAPVTGGGMMAIHRDRSVADLKGRRAYFNHCFTASSSPPSRLSYPFLSLYLCTILLLYLYYPSTYVFAYPPSILFLLLLYCPDAYFQLDYAAPRAYPSQICTNLFALSSVPHANLHVIRNTHVIQVLELYTQADSLFTIFYVFFQADWQSAKADATNDRQTLYHGYQAGFCSI